MTCSRIALFVGILIFIFTSRKRNSVRCGFFDKQGNAPKLLEFIRRNNIFPNLPSRLFVFQKKCFVDMLPRTHQQVYVQEHVP